MVVGCYELVGFTCFPKCGEFLWKCQEPQVDELFLGLVEVVVQHVQPFTIE